jgi:C4-dicarboxylate-specific signal transduction histidine kinase
VLLLPLAIGAVWSSNRTRLERRAELNAEAASIVATSIVYFDQYLHSIDSMASVLAQHPAVVGMIAAESDRLFADMLRGQRLLLNIVLRDADGTLRGSGLEARDVPNPIAQYVRQVVSSGQPVVSDLIVGPVSHKPSVVFVYPVRRADGAVVGVIDFGIDLMNLETAFARIPLPEGSTITLTDRRGLVLARSRDADRYIGTTMEMARPADRDAAPRMSDGKDLNGVDSLFASAVVGRGEWVMTVGIPKSVVGARLWPLYRRTLAISAVTILISLMVSLWFGSHLSRQLKQFRTTAGRIAEGDLSPHQPDLPLNRELSELQDSFVTMADRLRTARESLASQVEHERKIRERVESLQKQVVRQERLAAVGVLVSGVAHELNNPLQAIVGAAELLERRSELSPDALREVGLVKVQSGRASEIIRNLSRFGNQQPGPAADIDLRDVIGEAAQLRRSDLQAAQIAFDVQLSPARKVSANFTEIEQVILNFVINAQQSIQEAGVKNGRVIIRLFDRDRDVRVEVIDNGPGVKPEHESKLFQPFFTTKEVGMGTGLGLSVSYGIIDSCGGRIGCEGNAFGGATFFFELPAIKTGKVSA